MKVSLRERHWRPVDTHLTIHPTLMIFAHWWTLLIICHKRRIVRNLFCFLSQIQVCVQQSVTVERNHYTKHVRTWGLKGHICPPSLLTAHFVRSPLLVVIGLWLWAPPHGSRKQQTHLYCQHSSTSPWPMLSSMLPQHGAIEPSSTLEFHVHGCHVFEDRDLVSVLR